MNRPTSSTAPLSRVFDPSFLRKLDRLQLTVRHALSTRPGSTPMPRGAQGSGIEIEGHKPYHAGDDLRHVDWNAYSRLDQLVVRTFRAEREAPLHLFVDVSASMTAPESDGKLDFARQLAASLAYIALRHHDPVRIAALGSRLPQHCASSPVFRHRNRLASVRAFLETLQAQGETALDSGIDTALCRYRTPGVAVVISDFLTPPPVHETIPAMLAARGFTTAMLRVLGRTERDPSSRFRKARIVDVENGAARYVTLNPENLSRYEHALEEHLQSLRTACARHSVPLIVSDPAAGIEHCLFHDLPRAGVVH